MIPVLTAKSEYKLIKSFPFMMNIKTTLKEIQKRNAVLLNRRAYQTTLKLEHELRMCEVRRCLPILKELEEEVA